MTSSVTDSNPTTIKNPSTYDNVGPVPEKDPLIHSEHDVNRDVLSQDRTHDTESKGIVGSVVDAAKTAAYRVREALVGEDVHRTAESDRTRTVSDDVNVSRDTTTSYEDRDTTGRSTSDKIKDTAYDVKEKVKDTAYDAKEKIKDTAHDIRNTSKDTAHDIRNTSKDTAHDIKNTSKDTAHDVRNTSKDTAYDIHDRTTDTGHDYSSDRTRDTTLSSDTNVAADSNKQRLRDIKEKVVDAAQAPIEMAQTMWAAGKERVKEAWHRGDTSTTTEPTTTATSTTPGTADMFSQDYQPGPAQYQTEPTTTDQAKSKLASTAAGAADKAETWIAEGKQKMNEQADKAQDLAADTKAKANVKAQEPANDTRYYSGAHGQTY